MADQLQITPIAETKSLVDLLADMGIDPLHLHVDGAKPLDARPNIKLWTRYRTEFFTLCERLGAKPEERRFAPAGQREWYAESDTLTRRLLVQCVSFEHHDDWEPRPNGGAS